MNTCWYVACVKRKMRLMMKSDVENAKLINTRDIGVTILQKHVGDILKRLVFEF